MAPVDVGQDITGNPDATVLQAQLEPIKKSILNYAKKTQRYDGIKLRQGDFVRIKIFRVLRCYGALVECGARWRSGPESRSGVGGGGSAGGSRGGGISGSGKTGGGDELFGDVPGGSSDGGSAGGGDSASVEPRSARPSATRACRSAAICRRSRSCPARCTRST